MSVSVQPCCLTGFRWDGTPTGRIGTLGNNTAYIAGSNPKRAILLIHDLLSWTWPNIRLLADHFALEADATVYLPDFFGGETLPFEPIVNERFDEFDLPGFIAKNTREIREPEIFDCARALRDMHYNKVAAIGYCYGGWAVFRLGAQEHSHSPLVDCITAGHPTFLTKKDIDEVSVPVQLLAPEIDPVFTAEMKSYAFEEIQKKRVMFEYVHFPGVEHSCFTRGNLDKEGEREAMVRGKDKAVEWFKAWLGE